MMTADEILKLHIGNLMVQVAMLQAENEKLKATIEANNLAAQGQVKLAAPATN